MVLRTLVHASLVTIWHLVEVDRWLGARATYWHFEGHETVLVWTDFVF